MPAGTLIPEDSLKDWSGYRRRSDLEAWLRERHIPYTYGKGGRICTTEAAVTAALGGLPLPRPADVGPVEFA